VNAHPDPAPPVRMAHLGLGAFHRAHQAWYTQQANQAEQDLWGYESFTGRSPTAARMLTAQGCRYHLVIRGPEHDRIERISSIVRASHGGSRRRMRAVLAAPSTALASLTVTEAGYHLDARGELDSSSPAVVGDLSAVRAGGDGSLTTAVGRLVDGLISRRDAGAGGIALVSCDNIGSNGAVLERAVLGFAAEIDPGLANWIEDEVGFVSTMVDRITPALDERMRASLPDFGQEADRMPVVAEPFTEWFLAGRFPAGRPAWEAGGARVVADVAPFEERKLWILNAGHSLLAYLGSLRGHASVAEAMTDPVCVRALERLWDEAAPAIRLPREEIRAARLGVAQRWRNPRIEHLLRQISRDGLHKLRVRLAPVLVLWREHGWGLPEGQLALLGTWVQAVRAGVSEDVSAPQLREGTLDDGVRRGLAMIAPSLAGDEAMIASALAAARAAQSG